MPTNRLSASTSATSWATLTPLTMTSQLVSILGPSSTLRAHSRNWSVVGAESGSEERRASICLRRPWLLSHCETKGGSCCDWSALPAVDASTVEVDGPG